MAICLNFYTNECNIFYFIYAHLFQQLTFFSEFCRLSSQKFLFINIVRYFRIRFAIAAILPETLIFFGFFYIFSKYMVFKKNICSATVVVGGKFRSMLNTKVYNHREYIDIPKKILIEIRNSK